MGPRACLDIMATRRAPPSAGNWTTVFQPVAGHFTELSQPVISVRVSTFPFLSCGYNYLSRLCIIKQELIQARVRASMVTRIRTGRPGLDSRQVQGRDCSFFRYLVQTSSGLHSAPIHGVPEVLSPWVKRSEREADHSPSSSVEVTTVSSYTSTPQYTFTAW
jgi:hypothetical protein